GGFWADMTANLPNASARGITASRAGNAIYVATDQGLFYAPAGLGAPDGTALWQPLTGLPAAPVTAVQLDASGNQLWAAVEGFGVYATAAPHQHANPQVVSSADLSPRPAAPGSLMTVNGALVSSARAGDLSIPVFLAKDSESQIQIPFEAR